MIGMNRNPLDFESSELFGNMWRKKCDLFLILIMPPQQMGAARASFVTSKFATSTL